MILYSRVEGTGQAMALTYLRVRVISTVVKIQTAYSLHISQACSCWTNLLKKQMGLGIHMTTHAALSFLPPKARFCCKT